MRLNIEFVTPWLHGKPIKTWIWHKWGYRDGPIRNSWAVGFTLMGFFVSLSNDCIWTGIGLSLHLFDNVRRM